MRLWFMAKSLYSLIFLLLLSSGCKHRTNDNAQGSDIFTTEASEECYPGSPASEEKCGLWFPYDYEAPQEMYDLFNKQQWIKRILEPSSAIANGKALGLTEEESLSVRAYTQYEYIPINNQLRTKNISPLHRPVINLAASGLRKLPKFVGTVYRGTELKPEILAKYKTAFEKKVPLQELGFLSTTSSESYLNDSSFGMHNARFIIESTSGTPVDRLSHLPVEKEVLFTPGNWFQIVDIKNDAQSAGNSRTIIMMKELPLQ
ncbi:MAG: ADP-ribosyltransferase [Oligoflexales bacterium]